MLKSLYVSGLALIRRLSVDLDGSFTILTGETGAGKSLILDSLNLFLKPGPAKDLVRRGEKELQVSLFFDELGDDAKAALAEYLSPEELAEGVTLSRTVTAEGKSLSKLCGRTLPQSAVRAVAEALFAIHGQNDTGKLLQEKNHLGYLDSALPRSGAQLLADYAALWEKYQALEGEIAAWQSDLDPATMLEVYDFQVKEIARVKPKPGEEEALEQKLTALEGADRRKNALRVADRALSGGEKGRGAAFLLSVAAEKLESLSEGDLAQRARDLAEEAGELANQVSHLYADALEEDPGETMEKIRKRLDLLFRLKQKYGGSLESVLETYEKAVAERDRLRSRDGEMKRLNGEKKRLLAELQKTGEALRALRQQAAAALEEGVGDLLSFLDMPGTRVRVAMEPLPQPGPHGLDKVAFLLAANAGEGEKPLAKVASGGELSRIMLALQLKLGKARVADTVIFDEIDTGISGATSQKIGICLKALGQGRQVLCVTHSAQVASLADHHFKVEKGEADGRTETTLLPLDEEGSLEEIARILGGKTLSRATRENALALREEGMKEYALQKSRLA